MPVNAKINKMFDDLSHYDSKFEGLFKTTHLDKLVLNAFTSPSVEKMWLGYYPVQMTMSYMFGSLFKVESQPDLVSLLNENEELSKIIGFKDYIPVQSTFSRSFNNELFHNPLDLLINNMQRFIGLKQVHKYSDINPTIMNAVSKGYLPTLIDGLLVSLSEKKFNYSTRGYSGSNKKSIPGAKLFLSIDGIASFPVNYDISTGKALGSCIKCG